MRRAMKTACLTVAALMLMAGLALAAPPNIPSNPSPADGATGVGPLPKLQWTGGNANTYLVYLNSSGGGTWFKKTTNDSWQIPAAQALPPDTDFTWQVKARNADGDTVGPEWSFTTGTYPFIAEVMPTLCRPTYAVDIFGTNFGTYARRREAGLPVARRRLWGKIVRWTDSASPSSCPATSAGARRCPASYPEGQDPRGVSNVARSPCTYGGGGTTW